MQKDTVQFLLDLTSFVPSLQLAHDECNEYWHPETPPLTTMFGELGHQLMKSFPQMSSSERASVFSLIEDGMSGGSEELQTGLATGLLEAIANRDYRYPDVFRDILESLGPASRKHVDGWIKFFE